MFTDSETQRDGWMANPINDSTTFMSMVVKLPFMSPVTTQQNT